MSSIQRNQDKKRKRYVPSKRKEIYLNKLFKEIKINLDNKISRIKNRLDKLKKDMLTLLTACCTSGCAGHGRPSPSSCCRRGWHAQCKLGWAFLHYH